MASYQRMQIKTTMKYPPHQTEWLQSKSPQIRNAGEDLEIRDPSCTIGGNVNWCNQYGK